jgi:hypothetical protein
VVVICTALFFQALPCSGKTGLITSKTATPVEFAAISQPSKTLIQP